MVWFGNISSCLPPLGLPGGRKTDDVLHALGFRVEIFAAMFMKPFLLVVLSF